MSIYRLFNHTYRDYVEDSEVLHLLNVIILSVAVGMFLFTAQSGVAFAGYASALGAGEFAFGLISALPVLAGLLQIPASYMAEKTGKYKKMFMVGGVIQRLSWIAVAFIPYLFSVGESGLWALIVLVTLAAMSGSFVAITHITLMASVIPGAIRGRYITTRQRVCTISSMVAGLLIAFALDYIPGFAGYTVVFAIGGVAGLIDILMYARLRFRDIPSKPKDFSLLDGIKSSFKIPKTRDFLLFWAFWSFAVNISVPFFNKYAIDVLSLSYMSMIVFGQIVAQILTLIILSRWGVFLDRYGSVPVMMISACASTVGMVVWLWAVPGNVWPLFLFNFLGGLFWCANEATMVNMQLSHTPKYGRTAALAVYAVLTSGAAGIAFIIGGALLEALSPVVAGWELTFMGTPFDHYKLLFIITMLLRFIVIAIFLPRVWNEKGYGLRKAYTLAYQDMATRLRYELSRISFRKR
ncbi:MAG: MFS transporter [Lachnospiraceae bacterium]|jgi:MFS family permease|nr:MFS transporter [Lachnospiraceae bacterium]